MNRIDKYYPKATAVPPERPAARHCKTTRIGRPDERMDDADEMARLQAEREKLPKTADGVLAYPGLEVRFNNAVAVIRKVCDGIGRTFKSDYGFTVEVEDADGPQGWVALKDCYAAPAFPVASSEPSAPE